MNILRPISSLVVAVSSLAWAAQQPSPPVPPPAMSPSQEPATAPAVAPGTSLPATGNTVQPPAPSPASTGMSTPGDKSPGVDNAHYVIGSEDNLQITVWREPTLSGSLPVRPDGMISMVLLGDVKAAGLTPTQLGLDISQRLRKFFQDAPSVTVQVMAVNSQRIYLVGEVGHVGPINLSPDMSPLQAIAAAGGPSPYANLKHIYILRGTGATQQKIPFNYKQALKGDNRQQIVLRSGDTIVVP